LYNFVHYFLYSVSKLYC